MAKKRNYVITILLAIAVIVVIVNAFRAEYSPYIKQLARVGTYINAVEAEAIIVRNETVVSPEINGVYESYVPEGEKVPKGHSLGAVVMGDIDETKMAELNRLNNEIEALTESISDAGVLSIEDDQIASTLSLSIDNLRYSAAKGNVQTALSLCEDIRILSERKSGKTTSSSAQEKLNELKIKRDGLSSSLGGVHRKIYSPRHGQYSYSMDGLEQVLTYENALKATPEAVDTYFEMTQKELQYGGVCKIINNYNWYLLFNLTAAECEFLLVGKEYEVAIEKPAEKTLKGVVKSISDADADGRCTVVMAFDKYIDGFTTARTTNIQICKEKYSGIYVPGSALRVHDGVLGVWVQNEISLEFKSVKPVYRTDEFLLVKQNAEGVGEYKNIMLYDGIVLNPDDK